MARITVLQGEEILDSRGNPTLRVVAVVDDETRGEASVPSGASTGRHEAHELRDGDPSRYGGRGVQRAVANVEGEIQDALTGMDPEDQRSIDGRLRALDGTPNKVRLGANALLGVSLAVARAAAGVRHLPLYRHLQSLLGTANGTLTLPVPLINVINGGRHADSFLDIQEFLILPVGAPTLREAIRMGAEISHALANVLKTQGFTRTVGDEGGYAPRLERNDEAFGLLTRAVEETGYRLEHDVLLGIDAAASEFFVPETREYVLRAPQVSLSRERLLSLYVEWANSYPLRTIEDPLHEDDWEGWTAATEKLRQSGVQVVGDDLFATNVERLRKGIAVRAATAILVKPNQIGTLTETLDTIRLAQDSGYGVIVSHRSGETGDTFIADLAVATGSGQIKTGGMSRSERIEKYNRLLAIERELGSSAAYLGNAALRTS